MDVQTAVAENVELNCSMSTGSTASPMVVTPPITFGEDRFISVEYGYFRNLYDYGYNEQGTCVVIALSILLGYYDNFVNDSYVASQYEQGNGTSEAFHQYLNGYVYGRGTPGGTVLSSAVRKLNHYLDDRQLAKMFETRSGSSIYAEMIRLIEEGVPFVATTGESNGADFNHGVVVYAVSYNTAKSASSAVFTCHMGWDHEAPDDVTVANSNARLIAASWFDAYASIKDSTITHSYTSWNYYDDTYHRRRCTTCAYNRFLKHDVNFWADMNEAYHTGTCGTCSHVFTQSHGSCWDNVHNFCMACGHSGSYAATITSNFSPKTYMVCLC